jgi:hypothetical protein
MTDQIDPRDEATMVALQNREAVQRLRMIGLARQHLPVAAGRLGQGTLMMQPVSILQQSGGCEHWIGDVEVDQSDPAHSFPAQEASIWQSPTAAKYAMSSTDCWAIDRRASASRQEKPPAVARRGLEVEP